MKKSEFKKRLKKDNVSLKNYTKYMFISTLLFIVMMASTLILQIKRIIPDNTAIIIFVVIVILTAIPLMIIDFKNDIDIKKLYNHYQKENKILNYPDKTKITRIIVILQIVLVLLIGGYITKKYVIDRIDDNNKIVNTLSITTNKGNVIETKYQDFDGFSIKVPNEFKLMSDEYIKIKYPNGNPPTMVYTNEDGTINIAMNLNGASIENDYIEKYTKLLQEFYVSYEYDAYVSFFERNEHQVGEIEFVSQAVDTDIYNHMMLFSIDGTLKIISFNCTEDYMSEWQEVSDFIIESVIFSD